MADVRLWEISPKDLEYDENVSALWPLIEQVERDTRGEWSKGAVLKELRNRTITGFAAHQDGEVLAFAGVEMMRLQNMDQVGRFRWCVAKKNTRDRWVHFFPDLADWMKLRGCSRIDGRFRLGWVRALGKYGLKQTHAVCEMELN